MKDGLEGLDVRLRGTKQVTSHLSDCLTSFHSPLASSLQAPVPVIEPGSKVNSPHCGCPSRAEGGSSSYNVTKSSPKLLLKARLPQGPEGTYSSLHWSLVG